MKRGIIVLFLMILFSSFASADIIFSNQINSVYNLGDVISVPVTIKTSSDVNGLFQINLICNENSVNFYKNGINLVSGEEKNLESSLVLIKGIIGDNKGTCKIKAIFGTDYILSNEFKISDSLNIAGSLKKTEFNAGENILITGKVTKETGEDSNGFVDIEISNNMNQKVIQSGTVNFGSFSINVSTPNNLKAGNYLLKIKAFEKDSDGIITNNGFADYNIVIKQVPVNLELIIENKDVMPGSSAKIKAILHDQTGDPIKSAVSITIKDSKNKLLEQKEIQSDEFIEYPIRSNEPPSEWKVFAVFDKLTTEEEFNIATNEKADIEIINKTVLVTNVGNVFYNKTLLIKVGDTPININVKLNVGKSKKYVLKAPDGEYKVDITTEAGDETSHTVSLTGGAVGIKELSRGSYSIFAWIVLILILGFIVLAIFRKIYKKPFFGHIKSKKKDNKEMPILREKTLVKNVNRAEISLSIKGEKQDASVICIKIKDFREIKSRKGSASETIQKIMNLVEENKTVNYENQDYLFIIFAPTKTRTFKNDKNALEIAKKIQGILEEHNKMFNQKIEFGISLTYGTIVAKIENDVFKFMSIGNLITSAKKIASLSKGEVLLGEKINDLLRLNIRTEKHVREGTPVFSVKEIKKENEEAKKFIDRFLNRQGKE